MGKKSRMESRDDWRQRLVQSQEDRDAMRGVRSTHDTTDYQLAVSDSFRNAVAAINAPLTQSWADSRTSWASAQVDGARVREIRDELAELSSPSASWVRNMTHRYPCAQCSEQGRFYVCKDRLALIDHCSTNHWERPAGQKAGGIYSCAECGNPTDIKTGRVLDQDARLFCMWMCLEIFHQNRANRIADELATDIDYVRRSLGVAESP